MSIQRINSNTLADGAALNSVPGGVNFRNRIINGDMRIDQRNAGAAVVNPGNNIYTVDRWLINTGFTGSVGQNLDSVTPPSGFTNYLGMSVGAAGQSASNHGFRQAIEGLNISDLAWGTASAQSVTLSFWVRCSLTGTFGGAVLNSAFNRSYPFSYTISSANTWEYKTLSIPGDTSGTWLSTNGIGIEIYIAQSAAAERKGPAGAWASSDFRSATGTIDLITTNGATFFITGVQLEVGTVATPFERRPFGTELALCQRYYYRLQSTATADRLAVGWNASTTSGQYLIFFPVTMRIDPTALEQSGTASDYSIRILTQTVFCSSVPSFGSGTTESGEVVLTVASGLTAGQGSGVRAANANAFLAWSAEL